MSVEGSIYGALDWGFGGLWNLAGKLSPFEEAKILAEAEESVRRARGEYLGQNQSPSQKAETATIVRSVQQQQLTDLRLQQQGGCTDSVANFLGCLNNVRVVVTVVFVGVLAVVALPYVARAYQEVKKSFG